MDRDYHDKSVRKTDLDAVKMYLKEIGQYPLLAREEERDLAKLYILSNDEDAKRQLINCNLRLVVYVAKQYASKRSNEESLSMLDLVQEGNIGLLKVIEKYDYTVGCKFSTYAIWWIRHEIS